MSFKRLANPFCYLLLSILLIPVDGFSVNPAAEDIIERQAYVKAAFDTFHGAIYFLAASDIFLNQLTQEERAQFDLLGNKIIKYKFYFGPPTTAANDQTNHHGQTRLIFSDRSEEFMIAPDKVERLAKMDGNIWFNTKMLNNSKLTFGLLDAFQILYHEFGHSLGDAKDQKIIDSIAAKMKIYLQGFYKESVISPGVTAKTLVTPYLLIENQRVDYQMEPIIIIDLFGRAVTATMDVAQMRSMDQGYITAHPTQNFTRLNLTPRFQVYNQKILVEWFVETKNYLIDALRFNYVNLYTNANKVTPLQALEPITTYKSTFQLIEIPEVVKHITQYAKNWLPVPLKRHAENPNHYRPDFNSKWVEKLKVTETKNQLATVEAVIQSDIAITEVILLGQHGTDALQIPGAAEKLTGNYYRVKFVVPTTATEIPKLSIDGIAINSTIRWDLEERLVIPLTTKAATANNRVQEISIWQNEKWNSIEQITAQMVDSEDVKIRFEFLDSVTDLNHLEMTWLIQEDVLITGIKNGSRFRTLQEVIAKDKLQQHRANGKLYVTMTSQKMSNYLRPETGKNNFTTQDSGIRALTAIHFVDQNYKITSLGARLENTGWRSAFNLKKPRPAILLSCQKLFSL